MLSTEIDKSERNHPHCMDSSEALILQYIEREAQNVYINFKYSLPFCCGHTMWLEPELVAKCISICVAKVAVTDSPPVVVNAYFYLSFIC